MSKKTENKWYTNCCGRCENPHSGYSGKLDKNGIEYVVCQITNKRMNVSGGGPEANSFAFPTHWIMENTDDLFPNPYDWYRFKVLENFEPNNPDPIEYGCYEEAINVGFKLAIQYKSNVDMYEILNHEKLNEKEKFIETLEYIPGLDD